MYENEHYVKDSATVLNTHLGKEGKKSPVLKCVISILQHLHIPVCLVFYSYIHVLFIS